MNWIILIIFFKDSIFWKLIIEDKINYSDWFRNDNYNFYLKLVNIVC